MSVILKVALSMISHSHPLLTTSHHLQRKGAEQTARGTHRCFFPVSMLNCCPGKPVAAQLGAGK